MWSREKEAKNTNTKDEKTPEITTENTYAR